MQCKGPLSCHQSNQKETEDPSPIFHRKSEWAKGLSSRIFFQVHEQKVGLETVQKFFFCKKFEWIHLHHIDSLSVKRIHMCFRVMALLYSESLRIPSPPSSRGRQTSFQATLAPPVPKPGPFQRNCRRMVSIPFKTPLGRGNIVASILGCIAILIE